MSKQLKLQFHIKEELNKHRDKQYFLNLNNKLIPLDYETYKKYRQVDEFGFVYKSIYTDYKVTENQIVYTSYCRLFDTNTNSFVKE